MLILNTFSLNMSKGIYLKDNLKRNLCASLIKFYNYKLYLPDFKFVIESSFLDGILASNMVSFPLVGYKFPK